MIAETYSIWQYEEPPLCDFETITIRKPIYLGMTREVQKLYRCLASYCSVTIDGRNVSYPTESSPLLLG
jgi:hypothetical protein